MKTKEFGKLIGYHPIEVRAMRKTGKICSKTVLDLVYDVLSEAILSGMCEKDAILELILLDRKQADEYGSLSNDNEEAKHKKIQRSLWLLLYEDVFLTIEATDTLDAFFGPDPDANHLWKSFYEKMIPCFPYEQRTQVYKKMSTKTKMLWKSDVETADTVESFNRVLGFFEEVYSYRGKREFFEVTFRNTFYEFLMRCQTAEEFFGVCKKSTIRRDTLYRGDDDVRHIYYGGGEAMWDVFDEKIAEWVSLIEIRNIDIHCRIKSLKALLDSATKVFRDQLGFRDFSVNTSPAIASFSLKVFQEAYNQAKDISVDEMLELVEICSFEDRHSDENDVAEVTYYKPFFSKELQLLLWQEIQNNESMDNDRFNKLFQLARSSTKIKIMDKMIRD